MNAVGSPCGASAAVRGCGCPTSTALPTAGAGEYNGGMQRHEASAMDMGMGPPTRGAVR